MTGKCNIKPLLVEIRLRRNTLHPSYSIAPISPKEKCAKRSALLLRGHIYVVSPTGGCALIDSCLCWGGFTLAPARKELTKAYEALQKKTINVAIDFFRQGIAGRPTRALHKDLAYTYLKTGENAAAGWSVAAALKFDRRRDKPQL